MDESKNERRKTKDQIAAIEEVQRATEAAMEAVIQYVKSSPRPISEEAHAIIDRILETYDCESPEGHIVAGGIQSADPHAKGAGELTKGVPIVIDIYPRSKTSGYWADMSRTVCIGTPSEGLQNMYDAVVAAHELAVSLVKPQAKCAEIQDAVDRLFIERGFKTSGKGSYFKFAEGFVHSVGHGLGKDVHEAPRIGRGSEEVLEEGDVITIEPALYYKHIGGVRVEDLVVVTKSGARNLTRFPKQFQII